MQNSNGDSNCHTLVKKKENEEGILNVWHVLLDMILDMNILGQSFYFLMGSNLWFVKDNDCISSAFEFPRWAFQKFYLIFLCVSMITATENRSRERDRDRDRATTLEVPDQQRPTQYRSRSVSPHRDEESRGRSRPPNVPAQRYVPTYIQDLS